MDNSSIEPSTGEASAQEPLTETGLIATSASWRLRADMTAATIETEDDYRQAIEMRMTIDDLDRQAEKFFEPMKTAAWNAHKAICTKEHDVRDPLQTAGKIIKKATEEWKQAADAEAARKQAEIDRVARELEEARLRAIAYELRAQGQADAAAEVEAAPVSVRSLAPTVVGAPKIAGVSYADTYEPVVLDVKKLLKAAAAGKVPSVVFVVDMVFLRNQTTKLKMELNYPGVEVRKGQQERLAKRRG